MQLWEGVRLAMQQLVTEKLKSFFSLLGVIIGVMFLIVVVSIVEGMDRYMNEEVASQIFGVNTVTLRRSPSFNLGLVDPEVERALRRRPRLTHDDALAIRNRLTIPSRVLVQSSADGGEVVADNGVNATNVNIVGASPEMFPVRDLEVETGRAFSQQEADRGVAVVVLGSLTAEVLFGTQEPLGRSVRIGGFPYRVIGVLEERGSIFGQSLDGLAIAPISSPLGSLVAPRGYVDEIIVQSEDPGQLLTVKGEVEGIMRARRGLRPRADNNFSVETADDALSFWDRISEILFLVLPGLVAISLVVGGIVIMNIMLVSVMERTREIGVRKALGARRRDILTQVIIEATTLSTIGAIAGVGVGMLFTGLVRAVSPMPAAVSPQWVAVGVLLGTSVGIVAGVYPASRASKLDPVDALRYE